MSKDNLVECQTPAGEKYSRHLIEIVMILYAKNMIMSRR